MTNSIENRIEFNEKGVKVLGDGRVRIDGKVAKWEDIKDDSRFNHIGTYDDAGLELYKVDGNNDWYLEVYLEGSWTSGEDVNATDADLQTILEQYK